jgi:hypothetical protein
VEIARAGLKDYCDRRHIATFDLVAALAASGLAPGMAPDQLHLDTETNDFEAALVADVIAGSLA